MAWDIKEASDYYKNMGAPEDQSALLSFLKEMQQEKGGFLNNEDIARSAASFNIKESFLTAFIKRFPSLKLKNCHTLSICSGPVCSKSAALADFAVRNLKDKIPNLEIKITGCMKMCRHGPNIKFDGKIYNNADKKLIIRLTENLSK